jgi:hypothetical protein
MTGDAESCDVRLLLRNTTPRQETDTETEEVSDQGS